MLLTLVKLLRDIIDDHVINVSLNFCYGSMTLAPYCIQFSDSTETEKQIQWHNSDKRTYNKEEETKVVINTK